MSKRFDSVYELSFSIDHNERDGSDLTLADFIHAIREVIDGGYSELALEGPFDTYEIPKKEDN